jgi:sugar lactone lactonase YvrE
MRTFLVALVLATAACAREPAPPVPEPATLPSWTFDSSMVFPADQSLTRPEDGVVLADGRLIVVDQIVGLRLIEPDGSSRAFGTLLDAGYVHEPPALAGAANGASVEPDGEHLLVSDVFGGGIYRVNVATEATDLIYQHDHGVNTVRRDGTGAIWFTQSTEIERENAEETLFRAVDVPTPDGALFRLAPAGDGNIAATADRVLDGLYFANGFDIDEAAGRLYISETTANRVLGFDLDIASGQLSNRAVLAEVMTPDNVELDGAGRLWVVSPIRNELVAVELESGEVHSAFRAATPDNDRIAAEWQRRGDANEPRLELMAPDLWMPLPGIITGVILTPSGEPVWLTGLGDSLVRLAR